MPETYALHSRQESGELMGQLERGRSEAELLTILTDIVDGHGLAALKHYTVQQEDFDRLERRADQWWRLRPPLLRISEADVIVRLMASQGAKTTEAEKIADMMFRHTVRYVVRILDELGLVIAEHVEEAKDA